MDRFGPGRGEARAAVAERVAAVIHRAEWRSLEFMAEGLPARQAYLEGWLAEDHGPGADVRADIYARLRIGGERLT